MLPLERIAGQSHGRQVEGGGHVPGGAGGEGVRERIVQQRVPVPAAGGRPPGVEARGGHLGGPDDYSGPQSPVQGPLKGDGVHVRPGVEGDDLTPGVDAGVGASGTGDLHRVAEIPLERGRQDTAHRAHPGLQGEAVEASAVVGNQQPYPLGRPRRHRAGGCRVPLLR